MPAARLELLRLQRTLSWGFDLSNMSGQRDTGHMVLGDGDRARPVAGSADMAFALTWPFMR